MATTNPTHDLVPNSSHAPLFSQVHYHIIKSQALSSELVEKYTQILNENGAVEHAPPSIHGRVPLNGVTHIISTTIDFEEYEAISNALIPIVKPEWIASSVAKKKLANPRSHSADPRLIFSGLVVSCADLPDGDKDAIIGGVLAMGGLYSPQITKLVTHLVALNMDPEKCRTAVAKNLKCKLVLPHWFDDCLRLGKRIDESPYVLPDPEIHRLRFGERIPDALRPDLQGALSAHPGPLPTPSGTPSSDRQELSVFQGKEIFLSRDLEIAGHLRETIEGVIRSGGGSVTTKAERSDILVCQYREGDEYKLASRAGKVVGNLPWLYHLITHNTWTSPLRRLLHYPIARKGLPGFRKFRISLSNYNGEARIYLENLAKAAGCEFTRTMKMDNTHLITAHTFSEKCEAAKEWNINMINHLWLEESYAQWEIQSLTNPRYTHFPPRTNLSEVVGQTPINKKAIARHFFPEVSDTPIEIGDVEAPPQPGEQEDNKLVANKIPNSSKVQPFSSSTEIVSGIGTKDVVRSTPKPLKHDRPFVDGAMLKTPVPSKFQAVDKENETPSTSSSRGAKDRAMARLHDLAPDIALYEKEKKRVGGVVFGGRKTSIETETDSGHKRSLSRDDDSVPDENESIKAAKRTKKGRDSPIIRLLLTGYNSWVGDVRRENEARGRLRDLGILITQDPANCTHIAAPRILRTPKFLCAMAYAPVLLSTHFVDDCLAQNALLPLDDYRLEDSDGESRHEVDLAEVTIRAKANKCRLLRNDVIYCTEHIHGGFDAYKSIVEANGGRCLLYRARAGSVASSKMGDAISEQPENIGLEHIYLISGTTPKDAKLWPKFRDMVHAIGKCPRIVKNDWILDVALTQEMRWKDIYEMTDSDIKRDE